MAEIVFWMRLRGMGVPVGGRENTFHAETAGTGHQGESVTFEPEVVLTDAGFDEVGKIQYGGRGSSSTPSLCGAHGPQCVSGVNHGTIVWLIAEGDGEFSGASGRITANFTFSEQGDLVDNEYVRLYTP